MSFGGSDKGTHQWSLDETASRLLIRQAAEAGINFFDTANVYSFGASEEIIGRALKDFTRREEVVLATKVFMPWRDAPNTGGLSRKALMQALDDSLQRLGAEYIDLYQVHRWDYETAIEETMAALHDIVKSGKVRYIGASSMYAWQFSKAQYVAERNGWTKFISMQNQLNLIYREEEREMMPLCADQGVGVLPWSPLARGRLTRDAGASTVRSSSDAFADAMYDKAWKHDSKVVQAVADIAHERGVSRAQVAMAWLLHKPGITAPIVGVTKPSHLADAVAALGVALTGAEIERLEAHYIPHEVTGFTVPRSAVRNHGS
jgi:aryl-alcohol dehydrogenase-like predicted oxidoreductase